MTRPWMRAAGSVWLISGLLYLICEAIAARNFAGYSYAVDYISDLGIPYAMTVAGRTVQSRQAMVMNGGFAATGMLFATAAAIAFAACRQKGLSAWAFIGLALVHAAGLLLIAVFHSGPQEAGTAAMHYHRIGAAMAILGGNLAMIVAAIAVAPAGLPPAYRAFCVVAGIFGIASLVALVTSIVALPAGAVERASVYTVSAWQIVTGLVLLSRRWSSSFCRTVRR